MWNEPRFIFGYGKERGKENRKTKKEKQHTPCRNWIWISMKSKDFPESCLIRRHQFWRMAIKTDDKASSVLWSVHSFDFHLMFRLFPLVTFIETHFGFFLFILVFRFSFAPFKFVHFKQKPPSAQSPFLALCFCMVCFCLKTCVLVSLATTVLVWTDMYSGTKKWIHWSWHEATNFDSL